MAVFCAVKRLVDCGRGNERVAADWRAFARRVRLGHKLKIVEKRKKAWIVDLKGAKRLFERPNANSISQTRPRSPPNPTSSCRSRRRAKVRRCLAAEQTAKRARRGRRDAPFLRVEARRAAHGLCRRRAMSRLARRPAAARRGNGETSRANRLSNARRATRGSNRLTSVETEHILRRQRGAKR